MRKIPREVTRKMQETCEPRITRMSRISLQTKGAKIFPDQVRSELYFVRGRLLEGEP
jgi:hypothetical protein